MELSGLLVIFGVLAALVVGAVLLHLLIANRAKASKGGVQPPPEETGEPHPGSPPLESVESRS